MKREVFSVPSIYSLKKTTEFFLRSFNPAVESVGVQINAIQFVSIETDIRTFDDTFPAVFQTEYITVHKLLVALDSSNDKI